MNINNVIVLFWLTGAAFTLGFSASKIHSYPLWLLFCFGAWPMFLGIQLDTYLLEYLDHLATIRVNLQRLSALGGYDASTQESAHLVRTQRGRDQNP